MISINLPKAKDVAHNIRRQQRAQEFEPLDAAIAKQIPGTDAQALEQQRQQIRDRYALVQTNIEVAETVDQLYAAIDNSAAVN